jgi:hypothetical protein
MKLLRTTALPMALMIAAIPSLTSAAHAGGLGWGGWDWGGVTVGQAPDGTGFGYAPNIYSAPYDFSYATAYSSAVYGGYRYAYHPIVRRHVHAAGVVVQRHSRY